MHVDINIPVGETALQDTPLSAGAYTGVNIPTTISAGITMTL